MRVYVVITEEDGKTVKAPGVSETVRKRMEYRYAATNIKQVWTAIQWLRADVERDVVAIYEEHPSIQILERPKRGRR